MREWKIVAPLAACLVALTACATPHKPHGSEFRQRGPSSFRTAPTAPPIALLFTDYDRDRDRRVTPAELKAGAEASFLEADANQSGTLSALEFQAWAEKVFGTQEALPGFVAFDANIDLAISHDEFVAALTNEFNRLDANNDSALTRNELITTAPAEQPERGTFRGDPGQRGQGRRGGRFPGQED